MTPLCQRMIEDMQLRGLSKITQDRYVRAVQQLADHYDKSPDKITEEELRRFLLFLKNDKQASLCHCPNSPPSLIVKHVDDEVCS